MLCRVVRRTRVLELGLLASVDLCVVLGSLILVLFDIFALGVGKAWSRHRRKDSTVGVLGVQCHLRTEESQVFPLTSLERLEIHATEIFHKVKIKKLVLDSKKILLMARQEGNLVVDQLHGGVPCAVVGRRVRRSHAGDR